MTINGLFLASQLKLCRKAEFYIYIYIITFLPVIKYEKGFKKKKKKKKSGGI